MAYPITLPFWPASTDCVRWSKDNRIVICGNESIAVLSPRLKDRGQNGTFWDSNVIKINGFNIVELPRASPLPDVDWSIGEESSLRFAHAAAWSAPGLCKHGACGLAVLTSNHVLSIWADDGRRGENQQWQRELVVNKVISEYYERRMPSADARGNRPIAVEKLQRVKAFAWTAVPTCNEMRHLSADTIAHVVLVVLESGQILFVKIESPLQGMWHVDLEWKASLVGTVDTWKQSDDQHEAGPRGLSAHSLFFDRNKSIADVAAISDWRLGDGQQSSADLAYIRNSQLFTMTIVATWTKTGLRIDLVDGSLSGLVTDRADICGPLHIESRNGVRSAFMFAPDMFLQIDLPPGPNSRTSHHLDDRWDSVSGLAITDAGEENSQANIVSILSTLASPTSALGLPMTSDAPSKQTYWQDAIQDGKTAFAIKYGLDERAVQERVWGIAAGPLGDYVATCTTYQPSQSLAYVIQGEQACSLNITCETGFESGCPISATAIEEVARGGVRKEAVVFGLQRHLDRLIEVNDIPRDDSMAQITQILRRSSDMVESSEPAHETTGLAGLGQRLKFALLKSAAACDLRADRLATFIVDQASSTRLQDIQPEIVKILVDTVLSAASMITSFSDPLSTRVWSIYYTIARRLLEHEMASIGNLGASRSSHNTTVFATIEDCEICHTPITFESIRWARCEKKHTFSRCALTFIAIQSPGITKICGICGATVINECHLGKLERQAQESVIRHEQTHTTMQAFKIAQAVEAGHAGSAVAADANAVPPAEERAQPTNGRVAGDARYGTAAPSKHSSLARILLATCDACIYCDGRFVDG